MTHEERQALRLLVSEARTRQAVHTLFASDLCRHCHEPFERRRSNQAYCTPECQRARWAKEPDPGRWRHRRIPCVEAGCETLVYPKRKGHTPRCKQCHTAFMRGKGWPNLRRAA